MESDEAAFLSVIPRKVTAYSEPLEPLQSLINNFCVLNLKYEAAENVYRAHISLASSNTGQTSSRLCKSYAALFEQKSVGNAFIQPLSSFASQTNFSRKTMIW